MGFEDLEARLRLAFKRTTPPVDTGVKARIEAQVSAQFHRLSQRQKWLRWRRRFAQSLSGSVLGLLLLTTTGVLSLPFLENQVVGQIKSEGGVVEIIRGDESLFVTETQDLRQGDWVRVGHRGQATITTEHFASDIQAGTWLRVDRANTVFLDKGRLENTHWRTAQIKTNRGLVSSRDGGVVEVEVTDSGETRVLPSRESVAVYDLYDGQLLAQAGEKVVLRSDTMLAREQDLPDDLELSNVQIEAILGKLAITRTKALTGIENLLQDNRDRAHQEIMSAEQSFRSVVQILGSNRDMTISRRVNLEAVAMEDVYPALQARTSRTDLLTEAYALEQLFLVLEQNKNAVAFAPIDTGVEAYDRYVLLHYLASVATREQAQALQVLADNYVVSLLRKVQQSPVKMEQLAVLNNQVDMLPVNDDSEQFLRDLQAQLPPDLAQALGEKIDYWF